MHDISKLVDDISIDDLLDGHYDPSYLGKEKGKKPASVNENVLHTVRKAFAILQRQVPSRVKLACGEEENYLPSISSSYTKESGDKTEARPGETREPQQQLYQPKLILDRLAVSLYEDLDLMLQYASTAVLSSRSNDPSHSLEIASQQVSLPSFSWSHSHNNGHQNNKSNPDSVKVLRKSSCHGKWIRVRGKANVHRNSADWYSLCLESLTFDQSLVPSGSVKYILPETNNGSSKSVSSSGSEQASSSITASKDSESPPAPPCPKSLLAAQTLFDIATKSVKDPATAGGTMKSPKLLSPKYAKAPKSKSIANPEVLPSTAKSKLNGQPRYLLSKKVKLESIDRERNFVSSNDRNGYFSVPISSRCRSSPYRSERDQFPLGEANHNKRLASSNFSNPLSILAPPLAPPPPRFFDTKNSSGHRQQKPRKMGKID